MLQKQMLITELWWYLLKDYAIEPTNKPYKFSLCSSNFTRFFFLNEVFLSCCQNLQLNHENLKEEEK